MAQRFCGLARRTGNATTVAIQANSPRLLAGAGSTQVARPQMGPFCLRVVHETCGGGRTSAPREEIARMNLRARFNRLAGLAAVVTDPVFRYGFGPCRRRSDRSLLQGRRLMYRRLAGRLSRGGRNLSGRWHGVRRDSVRTAGAARGTGCAGSALLHSIPRAVAVRIAAMRTVLPCRDRGQLRRNRRHEASAASPSDLGQTAGLSFGTADDARIGYHAGL